MPYFRVIINGTGILIRNAEPLEVVGSSEEPIRAFYTQRVVRTATAEEAGPAAIALVAAEWQTSPYVDCNEGAAPSLVAEEIIPNTFFEARRPPLKGYTFYLGEDPE